MSASLLHLSQRAAWAEGQPISDLMARALANPDLNSLAAGFVDQATLPSQSTRKAFEALFADETAARAALQYGTTHGYPPLREMLLEDLRAADGPTPSPTETTLDQVIITAGSNQLLHLVGESLLDPGDIVLCAAPTYFVFLGILSNLGARSIGIPIDAQGILPEALESQLSQLEACGDLPRVKAIYVVSYYDNPCGITTPSSRKEAIVEIAKRWSRETAIHVIEDAAYRELRYTADDVPSMRCFDEDGETVIVAGTFSKSYSPGIRVGWGVVPCHLAEPICNQKGNIDFGSPNFSQHLMAKVMQHDLHTNHLADIRHHYKIKLDAMQQAAEQFLAPLPGIDWVEPDGGLYFWLTLPPSIDTGPNGTLFDRAIEQGMLYVPGEYCYPTEGEPVAHNTIRLSFGVQSPERIAEGIKSLSNAIQQEMQQRA